MYYFFGLFRLITPSSCGLLKSSQPPGVAGPAAAPAKQQATMSTSLKRQLVACEQREPLPFPRLLHRLETTR